MSNGGKPSTESSRQKLVQLVYDAIFSDVVQARLQAGSRLIQEELAAAYGVSRQPVQQALLLLRDHGIVHDAPRRGFVVATLDVDHVRNLYQVRGELEGFAARLAAGHGRVEARRSGAAVIAEGWAAMESGSLSRLIEADVRFHVFMSELSGNPVVVSMMRPVYGHMRRIMAEVMRDDAQTQDALWRQHTAILEAVKAGDEEDAERLARAHIANASGKFVARLQRRQDAEASREMLRRVRP